MNTVLKMSFLSFNNLDYKFGTKKLTGRSYTTGEALPIVKNFELMNKHEFTKAALDKNMINFVVHIAALEVTKLAMSIYPPRAILLAVLQ